MVRSNISLTLVALFVFGLGGYGQESPQPILVDEHGATPCDDSLARLDAFFADLSDNPNSTGLITITNAPDKRRDSVFRQEWVKLYTRYRGFDPSRIKIVRIVDDGDMRVSFWRIPSGAREPSIKVDASYEIPETMKPFLFAQKYPFGDPICPEIDAGLTFARFLKANPSASANVVVRAKSLARARVKGSLMVNRLVTYGIKRSRIRLFARKQVRGEISNWLPVTEFWFLP